MSHNNLGGVGPDSSGGSWILTKIYIYIYIYIHAHTYTYTCMTSILFSAIVYEHDMISYNKCNRTYYIDIHC